MTATEKDLLALEKQFWTGDKEFYRRNVDDSCLVAFGPEMAGVMSNKDIAATAKDGGNRWKNLDIRLKGLIEPADDVAILSYEASATRDNGEPYAALGQHRLCQAGRRLEDGVPPADAAVTDSAAAK